MIMVKRSRKNQVVIPKAVLERAGLGSDDVYFDVGYSRGRITLTPMQFEEKIPAEALARFEQRALTRQPGDRVFRSMDALIKDLHRTRRRNPAR